VIETPAIKPQSDKKACSLCRTRIRGKAFAYYDDKPYLDEKMRECIPICKGCDKTLSVYQRTLSLWYGLIRIKPLRRIPRETVKAEEKLRKKLRKLRKF
jgi:hypothetical protein